MQSFNIVKKYEIENKSFRVSQIYDQFDLHQDQFNEHFKGEILIPEKWNIGLIVGKSGTGKTTIANQLFKDSFCNFKYKEKCVIDDFEKNIDNKDIFTMLSRVGFASPPSWLKPYSVLSNGEKMRVDLARALLQNKEIIIFDEYTSVVDREIAKCGSLATHKTIKKLDKKFIAVSCHYDIMEWLQPDWIFSTDSMQMLPRGSLQRDKLKIEIRKEKGFWKYFQRYHYLSHNLSPAAHQYVAFLNNKPIAFCAVLTFPHPKIRPMRKVHRIVVVPDYQGLGIAMRMLDVVCRYYYDKNEFIGITTSLNGFAQSLIKNKNWSLYRAGRIHQINTIGSLNKTSSRNRNTYSLRYLP